MVNSETIEAAGNNVITKCNPSLSDAIRFIFDKQSSLDSNAHLFLIFLIDGVDYRTVNETLLYRRGGPDVCFNVSSISDGFVERMSERFRLRLSSRNPTVAATDTAIVTINDTDGKKRDDTII